MPNTFLPFSADPGSIQEPPRAPPPPPTLPLSAPISAIFRNFPHFLPTFCRSKIHQKSDPSKTHPKSQKSDPMAPKARFWSHFCTLFSPLFAAFSQNINFLQTCIFPRQGTIFKVLAPHFFIKNPFKNHVFSRCLPGPHFSSFYVDFLRKSVIFGPPLGSAGAQNGAQNR